MTSGYLAAFEQEPVCHVPPFFSQSACVLYCEKSGFVDGLADGVDVPVPVDGLADGDDVDDPLLEFELEPAPLEGALGLLLLLLSEPVAPPPAPCADARTGANPMTRTSITKRHFFIPFLLDRPLKS